MLRSARWLNREAASTGARLVRIHAREPAAWLGCLAAALPFGWLAAGVAPERMWLIVPLAIACGGLALAAALGDPPPGLPDGRQRPWLPLWLARSAWPAAGAMVAAVLALGLGAVGLRTVCLMAGCVAVGCAAAFGSIWGARRAGLDAAPAASAGLFVVATAATAATVAGLVQASPAGQVTAALGAGLAAWRLAGGLAGGLSGGHAAVEADAGFDGARVTLRALAMLTTLVAMAVCFYLAPQLAAGYSAVAIGWFLCLAVPIATAGSQNRAADSLRRSAVGRPALPCSRALAWATAVDHAALLGWPAVVAVFLPPVGGPRAVPPWAVVLVLAAAAVILTAAMAGWAGRGGETPRSAVLAAAASLAVGAAAWL